MGNKADTFSKVDMCIINSLGVKEMICYGMARSDVEKMLGTGQHRGFSVFYEPGISIFYRNDVVVGVSLERGSWRNYITSRGAKIGMNKAEIKMLYGDIYAVEHGDRNLDYYYNSVTEKLFDNYSLANMQTQEESVNTFIFSVIFDSTGIWAERIMLLDMKMAYYMC